MKKIVTIIRSFASGLPLVLSVIAASVASAAGQVSVRIVSSLSGYQQPAGLIEGSPGVFYGVALIAGAGQPAAYSVTAQGMTMTLANFPSGYNIQSLLVSGPNNRFYSAVENSSNPTNVFSVTSVIGGEQLYAAQNFTPSFSENLPGGEFVGVAGWNGIGYLVKCDLNGNVTSIYQVPSTDRLLGTPIYSSDGNYYGVATLQDGSGYVFRVTPSGVLTKLHNFPSNTVQGLFVVPLLQASDGNLYGATPNGGSNGTGTVYKLTLGGQYALLYSFPTGNDGGPTWLIEGSDGNLYGSTLGAIQVGGRSQLFRISKSGHYTLLYTLTSAACQCDLVQGSDGLIYGTAIFGGATGGGEVISGHLAVNSVRRLGCGRLWRH